VDEIAGMLRAIIVLSPAGLPVCKPWAKPKAMDEKSFARRGGLIFLVEIMFMAHRLVF